jgi:hypothetical protein
MAHALEHAHDYSPEQALQRIKSERARRSWTALILFVLAAIGITGSFYLSYRDVPAPSSPANANPTLLDPYR